MAELIRCALVEDVASGDATTLALVPDAAEVRAEIVARHTCVLAGQPIAEAVFAAGDDSLTYEALAPDGKAVAAGERVALIEGPARGILTAERTALNFMQRLTGIASQTAMFVDAVDEFGTLILDTRKTTPGYRTLEKYAVRCGGGTNHRIGLYDRIMIKDNHRALWARESGSVSLAGAVRAAREAYPDLAVEVEIESESEFMEAMEALPEWILLDNMGPDRLRHFVELNAGRTRLEASGGITFENVVEIAATGVDAISLGCLTHSVKAADLSLEILPAPPNT
ncbi:MAG: carboxylating nicotinate-nucleotide diphosphorylase [Kiritimatiellia bacterium]|nr:carboxylating nicotinate-nucleotide diphosphorylase [Kiritimatiellia bacterium]MDP6631356.1 carboxylating nicotinate-nucleotide diphosphorylase [Kiritimatiellia bacterium]MDP6809688.1 carboxylating nicotinate-nucleotide diphosphorylase [Kiritimatiellia bacterium]